jgi:PhnB protein
MMELSTYLHFNGDCEEAFKFYEQCTGGKIETIFRHEGTPAEAQVPPEWKNKILHARMKIGDQWLMASDAPPGRYSQPQGFSVSLALKDVKKGESIFNALAEGGKIGMPFQKTFWAAGFGMVTDRFGVPWMVNCEAEG